MESIMMHDLRSDLPDTGPTVLHDLGIGRTVLRSGLWAIALACMSVAVFLVMGETFVR